MTINFNNVENLVFSGGGVKVISYAGVLKALEQTDHLSHIQKVAGTSGGAITALCVALGYKPSEIDNILTKIDFHKFADPVEQQYDWIVNGIKGLLSWLSLPDSWTDYVDNVVEFLGQYGMHPGDTLKSFLEELVTNKGFSKDVTFKELNNSPISKELYVVMTNLNTQFPEIISHNNTPDAKVVECVHASGAFPFYFKPLRIHDNFYVDGGVMKNYPIDIFDYDPKTDDDQITNYNKIIKYHKEHKIPDDKTVGFKPINKELIKSYEEGIEPAPFVKVDSVYDYGLAVFNAVISSDVLDALTNSDRSVFIDDLGIDALNFDLTDAQKQALIDQGLQSTLDFIYAHNNEECTILGQDSIEYAVAA